MASEDFQTDPLAGAIPGQSFTDTPESRPYDKTPNVSNPKEAFALVVNSLASPTQQETITGLLDAGIPAETIASALVLKMFSEGVFTPDTAEIIKPPLIAVITDIGTQNGIEDVNVINEMPTNGITQAETMEIMQQTNPEKYQGRLAGALENEAERNLADMVEFPEEEEEVEQRNSFLDMRGA